MAKYQSFSNFLRNQSASCVSVTFEEFEGFIQGKLPSSAYRYPAWWGNDTTTHVQAKAWFDAGFRSEQVDMAGRKLVFRRVSPPRFGPPHEAALAEPQHDFRRPPRFEPRRHPIFGALKGTLTVAPGTDLTQPADPEWGNLVSAPPRATTE